MDSDFISYKQLQATAGQYSIKIWTDLSPVLSQCTHLRGRETDGQTAFS